MASQRTFTLNTGAKIPAVGFGTWQAAPHEVEKSVEIALHSGYRHIDCASIYRNETEVGVGISKVVSNERTSSSPQSSGTHITTPRMWKPHWIRL
jgi:diketogulonate reductase-like aldo/keto reductase